MTTKKRDYQLLADGMIVDGVDRQRGDTITIDIQHGERLAEWGSVGPVGTLEDRAAKQANRDADEQLAREAAEQKLAELEANTSSDAA